MELDKVRGELEVIAARSTADYAEEVTFPNGRGVSIIRRTGMLRSGGADAGLFEVAVVNAAGDLDYSTPVTSDVLGWQSVEDVLEAMRAVSELPSEHAAIEGQVIRGELAE